MQPHSTQLPFPFAYEEWRPILGFEGIFSVSDAGQVRRDGFGHGANRSIAKIGHILKGTISRAGRTDGYLSVKLGRGPGRAKTYRIHKLVAAAFLGKSRNGQQVNHVDGNKLNNTAVNLEYVTASEQIRHAYQMGLRVAHGITPFCKGFDPRRNRNRHPETGRMV